MGTGKLVGRFCSMICNACGPPREEPIAIHPPGNLNIVPSTTPSFGGLRFHQTLLR